MNSPINNPMEITPSVTTPNRRSGLGRLVAAGAVVAAGIVGLAAVSAEGGSAENLANGANVGDLNACVNGPEDTSAFAVNSTLVKAPYQSGFLVDAVCLETAKGFERIELGGYADFTFNGPDLILNASIDYKADPDSTTTTTTEAPADSTTTTTEAPADSTTTTTEAPAVTVPATETSVVVATTEAPAVTVPTVATGIPPVPSAPAVEAPRQNGSQEVTAKTVPAPETL